MTYRILEPEHLPGRVLDDLLARGWFRMRQYLFTTWYTTFEGGLHDAVWTRLALDGYRFGKRLRRRLRKVHERFRVEVAPAEVDDTRRALYRRYAHHVGDRPETLDEVLLEGDGRDRFDTWEVAVFDGDTLVAFSLFDRGHDSLQSVIGVYEPAMARHGLGFATLLLEIAYGRDAGFAWHYAGYIVPGVSGFDYKRRVGDLEAYDPAARAWVPLDTVDTDALPAARTRRRLAAAASALADAGLSGRTCLYPPWRFVCVNGLQRRYVDEPLVLLCGRPNSRIVLAVTYAPTHDTLRADVCMRDVDLETHLSSGPGSPDGDDAEWYLLDRIHRLTEAAHVDDLVNDVLSGLQAGAS